MAMPAFDTMEAAKRLEKEHNVPETRAEGIVAVMRDGVAGNLETKEDVQGLGEDVRSLKEGMQALDGRMHAPGERTISRMEAALSGQSGKILEKMDDRFRDMDKRFDRLTAATLLAPGAATGVIGAAIAPQKPRPRRSGFRRSRAVPCRSSGAAFSCGAEDPGIRHDPPPENGPGDMVAPATGFGGPRFRAFRGAARDRPGDTPARDCRPRGLVIASVVVRTLPGIRDSAPPGGAPGPSFPRGRARGPERRPPRLAGLLRSRGCGSGP